MKWLNIPRDGTDKLYMQSSERVIIIVIGLFLAFFYFYCFSAVNVISLNEELINKQHYLDSLVAKNDQMVTVLDEIGKGNVDNLKALILKKSPGETFVLFREKAAFIKPFVEKNKALYLFAYYVVGIILFGFLFYGIVDSLMEGAPLPKNAGRPRFYQR